MTVELQSSHQLIWNGKALRESPLWFGFGFGGRVGKFLADLTRDPGRALRFPDAHQVKPGLTYGKGKWDLRCMKRLTNNIGV